METTLDEFYPQTKRVKQDQQTVFTTHHPQLRRYINVSAILPYLNQNGLLTPDENEELVLIPATNSKKVDKLVIWLPKKPNFFRKFIRSLRDTTDGTKHGELADMLEAAQSSEEYAASCQKLESDPKYRSDPSGITEREPGTHVQIQHKTEEGMASTDVSHYHDGNDSEDIDEEKMLEACEAARNSDDNNTQVGVVLVQPPMKTISRGWNHFPKGCKGKFPLNRTAPDPADTKYHYMIYAVEDCLKHQTSGSIVYSTIYPDSRSALLMVDFGIKELIYLDNKYPNADFSRAAKKILHECGVSVRHYIPKCL